MFRKDHGLQTVTQVARGKVGMLSRESRMRLLRFINQIDWPANGAAVFVTLTYPDEIDHRDYYHRAKDRYLFLRHMEKHLHREIPVIWRLEWMPRKSGARLGQLMPHYHLLVLGQDWLVPRMVRRWWAAAIGHKGGPLATDVKRVTGTDGACRYLAKYVSKCTPLDIAAYHNSGIKFGRHWGVTRKPKIVMRPVECCREISGADLEAMQAFAVESWPNYRPSSSGGFTLLGEPEATFAAKLGRKA